MPDNKKCINISKLMNNNSKNICGFGFIVLLFWDILIFSAPVLSYSNVPFFQYSGAFLYLLFDPVCHQLPARSFFFLDIPFPVCVRCTSIYLGSLFMFGFSLISGSLNKWPRAAFLPALGLISAEIFLEKIGVYQNWAGLRIISGLLLGIIITRLLIEGLLFTNSLKGKTIKNG